MKHVDSTIVEYVKDNWCGEYKKIITETVKLSVS